MPRGQSGVIPDHGTLSRYKNHGCICDPCRRANRLYDKVRKYEDTPRLVDSTGTRRRIQALQAIGWSTTRLAAELGVCQQRITHYTSGDTVNRKTANRVAALFDRLSMHPVDDSVPGAIRTKRNAARHGYPPPLAWDDIDLDESPEWGRMTCMVDGCETGARSSCGLCEKHYRRKLRNGSPDRTAKMGRPRGEDATYNAVHLRLKRERGEARGHRCTDCGHRAQAWSYDHACPKEALDDKLRPYTTDLSHYQARCWPCHNAKDREAARRRRNPADLDEWLFLVRGGEDPERAAKRMGVSILAIERQGQRKGRRDVLDLARDAVQRVTYARELERKSA